MLVVDDHPVFRAGVKTILGTTHDVQVVAEAGEGREAIHLALERECDVILLDLTLPDRNGLEVLRAIIRAATVPVPAG